MPFAENAIVTREKLRDYLLSPTHPVGCAKAAWFVASGYTRAGWRTLRRDLRTHARECVTHVVPNVFGVKYIITATLQTPAGRPARLISVWFIATGEHRPRLVTAYPAGGR